VYRQGLMAAQARGDFRGRGGYYRGDPGLFGSIFKGITGAVGGFITGGPMGAVRGAISGVLSQAQAPIGATLPPPATFPMMVRPRTPASSIPPILRGSRPGPVVVVPRSGSWEPTEVMTPGHGLPKRRRMNIGNARALRRAIRRARGFEKLARKVMGFTSPRKPKGRSYFRASRKKS